MDWRDEGILLSARRHGESSAIIEVLTENHGRHAGVVRGGASRKLSPILQAGAQIDVSWRARLEEHIGVFSVEPLRSRSAQALGGRLALAGLNAVVALVLFSLPEREAQPGFYSDTVRLLDLLGQDDLWPLAYLRWEKRLLEITGFGLDLDSCAVTGATQGLHYLSPKTGRAVSLDGAGEWAPRLLPLPPILRGEGRGETTEVIAALQVTGHFLSAKLAPALGHKPLPDARDRFVDLVSRSVSGDTG